MYIFIWCNVFDVLWFFNVLIQSTHVQRYENLYVICMALYTNKVLVLLLLLSASWLSTRGPFRHVIPLQWPHADVHNSPFLQNVHVFLLHFPPQLHLMIFMSRSGAGFIPVSVAFQPYDTSGEISFPRHACTWWNVRWLCKAAASEVGGSFSGGTYM